MAPSKNVERIVYQASAEYENSSDAIIDGAGYFPSNRAVRYDAAL